MITTAQEYFANLDVLQSVNQPSYAILPAAENTFNVNVNTRVIEAPAFLSIEKDHKSETIYFIIDRYVDYMDLSQTCCIIHYQTANKKSRYYSVPFYDIYTKAAEGKIIFPWSLDASVTNTPGLVQFSIRFFKIGTVYTDNNESKLILTYNLNTLPAVSKVLEGMAERQLDGDEYYLQPGQFEQLNARVSALEESSIVKTWWTILDDTVSYAVITPEAEEEIDEIKDIVELNE